MIISSVRMNTSGRHYKLSQGSEYMGDDYWKWWIFVEGSDNDLDRIENVVYNLHYTFVDPVRTISTRENNFRLETSGWGVFPVYARINFKDHTVLEMEHELELYYPGGKKCEK